jgi:voltage-dependent potassium channel beta subunit
MTSKPDCSKMDYRYLGNSGLRVSVVGWGNWVNNDNDQLTLDSVKVCLENGINFFDTAEAYGFGGGEISLGKAFKELGVQREKVVVSTKIFRIGEDPNDGFLSRKHIIEGIKNSLKRLELDYVDVVFCHRPDMNTPLEETCRAMNWVIDNGYAFYWGTSEWSASLIMEAYKICEKLNLIPPIVEQSHYNMMTRERLENEYRDLFKKYKMGTTIWSPLESGVLTGKYINEIPDDSRYKRNNDGAPMAIQEYLNKKKDWDEKLLKLKDIAENKLNCSLAQLALAWVIANPDCSTTILGASKTSQLEENIKAVEISKKLDKNLMVEIEKILDNVPKGEIDYREWKELPSRRNINLGIDYVKGGAFN